ncbi:MAG: ATP-binding protein [Bacteroidales bacterium]|nr:ATP-binding protein [Bacteroidales bacterium]
MDQRLVLIRGSRGTGKTTLLLQILRSLDLPSSKAAFISLDDMIFNRHPAEDFADWFVKRGGEYLFIDEVHRNPLWSVIIKSLYDRYPDLKMVISGSSALQMERGEADLSRRMLTLNLNELSLREFISMKYNIVFPAISMEELLTGHEQQAREILSQVKPLMLFDEYLKYGAYPYFLEGIRYYHERLANTVNAILDTDLPAVSGITYGTILKIRKLLSVLAEAVPFTPNINELSGRVGISRDLLYRYLHLLEQAGLIYQLRRDSRGISMMSKPEKIYLHNTNLSQALTLHIPDKGSERETFFLNQVSAMYKVNYPDRGDFVVEGRYTIEVGGRNKTGRQIAEAENAFIVKDDIEYGSDNTIPLWLFGFLY